LSDGISCDMGKYASSDGSTICTDCQAGKLSNSFRAGSESECRLCKKRTYASTVGASSNTECKKCPVGTASDVLGAMSSRTCQECGANKYADTTGLTQTWALGSLAAAAAATPGDQRAPTPQPASLSCLATGSAATGAHAATACASHQAGCSYCRCSASSTQCCWAATSLGHDTVSRAPLCVVAGPASGRRGLCAELPYVPVHQG
jgi:hypothetical protein